MDYFTKIDTNFLIFKTVRFLGSLCIIFQMLRAMCRHLSGWSLVRVDFLHSKRLFTTDVICFRFDQQGFPIHTVCFRDLAKLNLIMVVRF
jgi:hypothetical protein